MLYLSKSKYTRLWQCPKMLWMDKNMPERATPPDAQTLMNFEAGNQVGDLAMGLFGDFVEVTAFKEDEPNKLDLALMVERTKEEMEQGTKNICEASFFYGGLYCAVDILRKDGEGWAIYEVKSGSNKDEIKKKPQYIADIAFQKYVLEKNAINVTSCNLVRLNHEYRLEGELDIQKLFISENVDAEVAVEYEKTDENLKMAEKVMASAEEPDIRIGAQCKKPYKCAYMEYCHRGLPKPSVFDLYNIHRTTALKYYERGLVDFKSLYESGEIKNEIHLMQIDHQLNEQPTHIEKESIRAFLATLHYPLYFLDFETMSTAIPIFQKTKPKAQIPFQYSLHYIEQKDGELKHKEFLAESGPDPLQDIAESLCKNIPDDACIIVYNKTFECGRLEELAEYFPDLSDRLLRMKNNIVDLMDPFKAGYYYNKAMGGSFSIKSVLPAVFPDDPELDYHNLEGVQNGGDAMTIFPKIKDMPPEEAEKTRQALLKYCKLDTYAMVKLWQELERVVK